MIIDIHTHTYPTSDDSMLTPEELIQEAKRIGLDGVCITDHDGFWDPKDVEALSQVHDFLVLPGCEVTTEEGHLLVYGLEKYIFGMHRASFVRDLVEEAGGGGGRRQSRPATRTCQARRIAPNQGIVSLDRGLPQAYGLLGDLGRLAVLSYHSLEDRIVKTFFRRESRDCVCPPRQPACPPAPCHTRPPPHQRGRLRVRQ